MLGKVCEGWLRQSVPCEVVIAVANVSLPPLPAGVRIIECSPSIAAPGVLRNLAAEHAHGTWLYLSDADVCPVTSDFMRAAITMADGAAMAQPWQYRLVGMADLDDEPLWRELATRRQCFLQADETSGRIVPRSDERYVKDVDFLAVVPPDDVLAKAGPYELRWRPPFHWGGLLLEQAAFAAVGGYCADDVGWGCEDDDLLAKVELKTAVTVGWRTDPTLRCLHFEHERPYGTPGFAANQALLARRLASGPALMIEADLAGSR